MQKTLANNHPLKGWIPYKLISDNNKLLVQWIYVSDTVFNHPFFEETIAKCRSHCYNSSRYKCVSSLENMIEWSYFLPEIPPVTFIFHVSRCGSTLLSQLISINRKYTVLAEVPFFDELLRLPYKNTLIDSESRSIYLQAAIKFIGQNKNGNEERIFIKTDSWHIFFHNTFNQLFPTALTILLYRSPYEVIQSHQKLRGMQAVPGLIEPNIFDFTAQEIMELTQDTYLAKVLERYMLVFEKIITSNKSALLLNYNSGIINILKQIAKHLDIRWDECHFIQMLERSNFHSKNPQQNFKEELKKETYPSYLKETIKVYERLNEKRTTY